MSDNEDRLGPPLASTGPVPYSPTILGMLQSLLPAGLNVGDTVRGIVEAAVQMVRDREHAEQLRHGELVDVLQPLEDLVDAVQRVAKELEAIRTVAQWNKDKEASR